MATVLKNTTAKAIGNYVGETVKQIRDGFGVYNYPNKFFRYEGEWREGKKHGHGRLIMSDGSFYEGSFENGEISGHGYRCWKHNGNAYTGQFEHGELSGYGVMVYGNMDRYEGGWRNNKRQGEGQLVEANGSIYKGSFHQHKKHGEGHQIYCNGNEYEGEWVRGLKQGHGTMKYNDGTIYDGQWRDDMFNGEGSIVHVSGVMFEGMWIAGRPADEAVMLAFDNSNIIEVEQGKCFTLEIVCQSSDGSVVHEHGRLLQISAGVKTSGKRLSIIEEKLTEEDILFTPFEFDAEPYPLTEISADCEISLSGRIEPPSPILETHNTTTEQEHSTKEENINTSSSPSASAVGHVTQSRTDIVPHGLSIVPDGGENVDGIMSSSSQGLIFPTVSTVRTISGRATFANLYLPSNPRSYSSTFEDVAEGRQAQKSKRVNKKGSIQHNSNEVAEIKDGKRRKDKKDDKYEEKTRFCKPGDYVIIVRDITSPPYLDAVLQPAYCHVKVLGKQKRARSKIDKR